jgi:3-phenylpropionate/cinnamic acid dioxygenase small subunit
MTDPAAADPPTDAPQSFPSVEDRERIHALLHEYCFRLDAGDLDGVAALFEDAIVVSTRDPETVHEGAAAVRTMYEPVILYPDGTPRTQHRLANITLTRGRPGEVRSRASFQVLQQVDESRIEVILAGEYHDTVARDADGSWHFRRRTIDPRLIGDLSRHMRTR